MIHILQVNCKQKLQQRAFSKMFPSRGPGECLSRKEVIGPLQLISSTKFQMDCHCNHNGHCSCSEYFHSGHSSCSGDFHCPPYCASIISAGISRLYVQEYLTKTVFEAIAFVFIMHPFSVGDQYVVNSFQLREDCKEYAIFFILFVA